MDTTGLPTITEASGPFVGDTAANQIKQLTGPQQVSVASLIGDMLAMATNALAIVTDTFARIIACGNADGVAVSASYAGVSGMKRMTLKPIAGQEGRSLSFEQDGAETSGFDAATKAAILAIVAPTPPRFAVANLVQRIAQDLPEGKEAIIVVDQESGKVEVFMHATHATLQSGVDLSALADENDGVKVDLSEPTVDGEVALPFEGAAT